MRPTIRLVIAALIGIAPSAAMARPLYCRWYTGSCETYAQDTDGNGMGHYWTRCGGGSWSYQGEYALTSCN